MYLEAGLLRRGIEAEPLADTGSHGNLASATDFIKIIERRQGLKIACLEEISYSKGWLDSSGLNSALTPMDRLLWSLFTISSGAGEVALTINAS